MWNYEKRLEHPINITTPNAKLAQFIMSQYGGPDIINRCKYFKHKFEDHGISSHTSSPGQLQGCCFTIFCYQLE